MKGLNWMTMTTIHFLRINMDSLPVLLSTAYFPPVEYFMEVVSAPGILLDKHENYTKQTYRNRCKILGANGPISLIIPVEKGRSRKTPVKDIRIYNSLNWQRNHWRTVFSAYNSSPFFEYYEEDLKPFFEKKWEFLFDLNTALLQTVLEILEIPGRIQFTRIYEKEPTGIKDLRKNISPKTDPLKEFKPYTQVFHEKFGFMPNLSIIDLLFNKGPESLAILENS